MVDHHQHHFVGAHVDRRRAIFGTAAALAGAALIGPGVANATEDDDDARPQAAPKPIAGVFPGTPFHTFAPGPTTVTLPFSGLPLFGLDVDPSVITDFSGSTALAYPVGSAQGSDGKSYNLEGDMRIYSGTYVPLGGGPRRHGTFGFVWIDLFEPSSGPQVHDFNGGVQVSGLFWIVDLPQDAIHFSNNGRRASVHAENVPVIDSFQFGGPNQIPAKVSYTVEWEATGPAVTLGKGKSVAATDPAAFSGDFAPAIARGSFSGRELAFSFKSDPGASSRRGYAEIGRERNGIFL